MLNRTFDNILRLYFPDCPLDPPEPTAEEEAREARLTYLLQAKREERQKIEDAEVEIDEIDRELQSMGVV